LIALSSIETLKDTEKHFAEVGLGSITTTLFKGKWFSHKKMNLYRCKRKLQGKIEQDCKGSLFEDDIEISPFVPKIKIFENPSKTEKTSAFPLLFK